MLSDFDRFWAVGVLVLTGLLVAACGGKGNAPNVELGTYEARVAGAVKDTLAGPVRYRIHDGDLVGLELGSKGGPGLSMDLERYPLARRTYEVLDTELFGMDREDASPGVSAFLVMNGAQFEATEGSLEITYVAEDHVGARFDFAMEGDFARGPSETLGVRVEGTLNAMQRAPDGS